MNWRIFKFRYPGTSRLTFDVSVVSEVLKELFPATTRAEMRRRLVKCLGNMYAEGAGGGGRQEEEEEKGEKRRKRDDDAGEEGDGAWE